MRVKSNSRPINRLRFSTVWVGGTGSGTAVEQWSAALLFLVAAGMTLGIGLQEPLLAYGFEIIVFALAACWWIGFKGGLPWVPVLSLAGISLWGFGQLALGASVYRFATLQSSLRFAAFAATAWLGFRMFGSQDARLRFLRTFSWFGAVVAVVAVLGYFTSPGKILWMFEAPYPDIWGCFPSRNNLAQFLELAMPPALWLALGEGSLAYLCLSAAMLAAGLASASRAGAFVLALEAAVLLLMNRKLPLAGRTALGFLLASALFAAMPGVGSLAGRVAEPDPLAGRREIAKSAVQMVSARPWTGFGLGTFPVVYPAFAQFDAGRSVDHAHNDWLEWTAEGGVGFSFFWLALAIQSARGALRSGWGIGVLGCFLHALVDYPFARFGVSAWVFILLGMLAAWGLREVPSSRH